MPNELITSLLSNAWAVLLVIFFFGGSIFVHELGHFLAARWRGVHVERFSIGFGPAIWSWRARDGVEYRIAWIPLGGYVLLPQLADLGPIEGAVTTDVSKLAPVSYTSKMIVFVAGAVFNVLFALALACIVWAAGQPESSETVTTRIGYISRTLELSNHQKVPGPALQAGLRVGDIVQAIDGQPVKNWTDIRNLLLLGSGHSEAQGRLATFTILRGGQTQDIVVHPELVGDEEERRIGIGPGYELLVGKIVPHTPAEAAGFKAGDEILQLNDVAILNIQTCNEVYEADLNAPLSALVRRDGHEVALTIPPRPQAKTTIAFGLELTTGFRIAHVTPFAQVSEQIDLTFRTFASILNRHSDVGFAKAATGPVGIIRMFYNAAEVGITAVLWFTILINVNLALFNLLPMPVLDGGQMLFATIGRLRGRALPVNFVMAAQGAFLVLMISVALYVTVFGDLRRMARDWKTEHAEAAASPAK